MAGNEAERWAALVQEVKVAPSPRESPALALLYELAMATGLGVVSTFRGLSEEEREEIVQTKFATKLDDVIAHEHPRRFFVRIVINACTDANDRRQTATKHKPELTRVAATREASVNEGAHAETLDMRACLESFSPRDRQVVVAVHLGQEREEVARQFRVTRANVDQICSRVRKRWREQQ